MTHEFNIVPMKRPAGTIAVNLASKSEAILERFPKASAEAVAEATEEVSTPPETVAAAPDTLSMILYISRMNQK